MQFENDYKEYISTPIQRLSENLNENDFYIKREDLFPISFGGNKARKALIFFEDALSKNADYVVTYGSSSSNHCRVISNLAAAKGLRCVVISPIEKNKTTYNSLMMKLFNSEIIYCQISEVKNTIEKKMSELKNLGYNPYFIQGGGHGNLGTKAYVDVYNEIKNYEKNKGVYFDYIFHASGTGTTQAGLVCGSIIHGDNRKIIGISIARRNPYGEQIVLSSVNEYLKSIGVNCITNESIEFIDDYVLDGYEMYNKNILMTIKEVLTKDGIPMDTTYTGKAFWGMKEYIKKNNIRGKNILFIHTGGTPLFFDKIGELFL